MTIVAAGNLLDRTGGVNGHDHRALGWSVSIIWVMRAVRTSPRIWEPISSTRMSCSPLADTWAPKVARNACTTCPSWPSITSRSSLERAFCRKLALSTNGVAVEFAENLRQYRPRYGVDVVDHYLGLATEHRFQVEGASQILWRRWLRPGWGR